MPTKCGEDKIMKKDFYCDKCYQSYSEKDVLRIDVNDQDLGDDLKTYMESHKYNVI